MNLDYKIIDHNNDWLIVYLDNNQLEKCNFFYKYKRDKSNKNKIKNNYIFTLPIFFALILSILLNLKISNENLYNKYYIPYKPDVHRSINVTKILPYDKKMYNIIENFYVANSLQKNGDYVNAIKEYKTIIKQNDNIFIEESKWYMALCYLKLNDNENAYKTFLEIAEHRGYYKSKANTIIRKMRK